MSSLATTMLTAAQEPFRKAGFGEQDFHGVTTLHPVGLLALVALGALCLTLRRRHAALPFILLSCLIPSAQRVIVLTLDFTFLRLLVLAGCVRIIIRGEYGGLRLGPLDVAILAWVLVRSVAYVALHGDFSAVIYRLGGAYDLLGLYFCFRCFVRALPDVDLLVRSVAALSFPVCLIFVVEKLTGRNHFAAFGGVSEYTGIREGRLRAQGPFPHAILAGCYFAVWLPLILALTRRKGKLLLGSGGAVAALAIIIMCASSTPVGAALAAFLGLAMWPLRHHMRAVRWSIVAAATSLHLVMKAPVWHLLSRVSFSGGSTSHHRYLLIDNAITHFAEWALIGSKDTGHWGHAMYDLTNQFVAEGVRGGLATLIAFVVVLALAFANFGQLWRSVDGSSYSRTLAWALGASLFVHVVLFFGVSISHSQQNLVPFVLLLAASASLTSQPMRARARSTSHVRPPGLLIAGDATPG